MTKRKPAPFDFAAGFEFRVARDDAERAAYYAEQEAHAAAREAVIKAAMEFWRVSNLDPDRWHEKVNDADARFTAACATLAALEDKP